MAVEKRDEPTQSPNKDEFGTVSGLGRIKQNREQENYQRKGELPVSLIDPKGMQDIPPFNPFPINRKISVKPALLSSEQVFQPKILLPSLAIFSASLKQILDQFLTTLVW